MSCLLGCLRVVDIFIVSRWLLLQRLLIQNLCRSWCDLSLTRRLLNLINNCLHHGLHWLHFRFTGNLLVSVFSIDRATDRQFLDKRGVLGICIRPNWLHISFLVASFRNVPHLQLDLLFATEHLVVLANRWGWVGAPRVVQQLFQWHSRVDQGFQKVEKKRAF